MSRPPDAGVHSEFAEVEDELAALRRRLDATRTPPDETLVADLEMAYRKLRLATDQVRAQQHQITQLIASTRLLRWQHERILAALPVPVVSTDAQGLIRSVNAAAAGLIGVEGSRMLRKPIFTLVADEDRPGLRRQLAARRYADETFHDTVTLIRRNAPALPVEIHASALVGPDVEVSWMLLSPHVVGDLPRPQRHGLAAALVRLAALPTVATDVQDLLHRAVDVCGHALDDDIMFSFNVGDPRSPTSVASSDNTAQELDADQMATGEGPGIDAYVGRATVVSPALHSDDRWAHLAHRVVAGTGSVSTPLQVGDELVGSMNAYVPRSPDPELVEAVELLAGTVAALLVDLDLRNELTTTAHQLEEALTSRATIDQAKGIVMAHRRCSPDEAFQHLVDQCSGRNIKLRDLAREIVDRASI